VEPGDSLLEFPCRFPIKAMGHNRPGFEQLVTEAVRTHVGAIAPADVETRVSSNGRYLSVTVTFNATSQAQVDAVYQSLTGSGDVLFLL
jgi:uncharacterized protein